MRDELMYKRPATVLKATVPVERTYKYETLSYPDKDEMTRDLSKMVRAGRIASTGWVRHMGDGSWTVRVELLPQHKAGLSRGAKLGLAIGVGAAAVGLVLVLVVKLLTAAVAALAPLLPTLIIGAVLLAVLVGVANAASGGRVVEVVTKVRVRG